MGSFASALTMLLMLVPGMVSQGQVSVHVRVQTKLHTLTLSAPDETWLHFSSRVASTTGHPRFLLRCPQCPQMVGVAGRSTWAELHQDLARGRADGTPHTLVMTLPNATSPAASVDPFWACERTNVPQPSGIAANWYWPKALTGNTHPGPSLPHGFVSVTAYSGAYPSGYGINSPSSSGEPSSVLEGNYTVSKDYSQVPYQYSTTGFAHFQPSGTGSIGNYMNYYRVMPMAGNASAFLKSGEPFGFRSTLVGERAVPGKYKAILAEHGIVAEVTATASVALHRYSYPQKTSSTGGTMAIELTAAGLIMPDHEQPMRVLNVSVTHDSQSGRWMVRGVLKTPPPAGSAADVDGLDLFVACILGAGLTPEGTWPPSANIPLDAINLDADAIASLGGHVGVAVNVESQLSVAELSVAFSMRSVADAEKALADADTAGFDSVANAAWNEWDGTLGRIAVLDDASAVPALRERNLFYSVLFHALRKPTDASQFVPDDWFGDSAKKGYAFDFGTMWDQYKTTLPLLVSVFPDMGETVLRALLSLSARFGEFPTGYTMDMAYTRFDGQANGLAHHTIADGLFRNSTAVDWQQALGLMQTTFTNSTEGIQFVGTGATERAHITHTLDLAGAAFATASVADSLNNAAVSAKMMNLSRNWVNAYDSTTCLTKNESGYQYYEGTYMNYAFRAVPSMADRIALCNLTDKDAAEIRFVEVLDSFFGYGRETAVQLPITPSQGTAPGWVKALGSLGYGTHTFEGLCNEPDMETPYTYAYARRADRVQEVLTAVKAYSYAPGRGGLVGNDDSGGEAAWFVWASIGIFPIAGQPVYIIGSPSFASVQVQLATSAGDKTLTINRVGAGAYIQSGALDNVDLGGRAWLWVRELHGTGDSTLTLMMGPMPSPSWGSKPPPSF